MRSSVKLHPTRWDAAVAAVILLLAAVTGGAYWSRTLSAGNRLQAVVSADGRELDRVDLTALSAPETRTYSGSGYSLTVEFSAEGVRVASSDCPNQDCVHTGAISRAGQSIVCLPAQVVVYLEGTPAAGQPDVIVG